MHPQKRTTFFNSIHLFFVLYGFFVSREMESSSGGLRMRREGEWESGGMGEWERENFATLTTVNSNPRHKPQSN
jgi:hypothetical protein